MSDLEMRFDRLAASVQTGPPPAAYLRAVRRRRVQRLAGQGMMAAAGLLIITLPMLMLLRGIERAEPEQFVPVPELATNGSSGTRPSSAQAAILPTALALRQLNAEAEVDDLVLPPVATPESPEALLRLGISMNDAQMRMLFSELR